MASRSGVFPGIWAAKRRGRRMPADSRKVIVSSGPGVSTIPSVALAVSLAGASWDPAETNPPHYMALGRSVRGRPALCDFPPERRTRSSNQPQSGLPPRRRWYARGEDTGRVCDSLLLLVTERDSLSSILDRRIAKEYRWVVSASCAKRLALGRAKSGKSYRLREVDAPKRQFADYLRNVNLEV